MIPNRNDEPDAVAAIRASGTGSGIEPFSAKYIKFSKKKEAGGSGGGSSPLRASKLQSALFPLDWWRIALAPSKVIFGLILAITYTSQIKVILGSLELL